jgi:hypothetical protein
MLVTILPVPNKSRTSSLRAIRFIIFLPVLKCTAFFAYIFLRILQPSNLSDGYQDNTAGT